MFSWDKDDIITCDKYLSLNSNKISYYKTDILINGSRGLIWRGRYNCMRPSKIWITGHSDYSIDPFIFDKYKHNCEFWFTINKNIVNDKIISLPLGITNLTRESPYHPIFGNIDIMVEVFKSPKIIKNLVYMNFNINTYVNERGSCYNLFSNKSWVTNDDNVTTLEGRYKFLKGIRNHKFVLCPRGNGIDTHRLWETLYMGSIPIVKKHIGVNDFNDLPILFIDQWEDLTEEFLNNQYKEIIAYSWNMDKLKFSYWRNKIIGYTGHYQSLNPYCV